MAATTSASSTTKKINGAHHATKRSSTKTAEQIREELRTQAAQFEDNLEAASARRSLAAWVASVLVGVGTAYSWNIVIDAATLMVLSVTGSSFLAILIYVLGVALAVYSTMVAVSTTFSYVVSSKPEQHYALAKDGVSKAAARVRSWFGRGDDVVEMAA